METTTRYIADKKNNVFTATPAFHFGHLSLRDAADQSRAEVRIHESELQHNRRFREVGAVEAQELIAKY
jgi:hypothetical protein